MCEEAVEVVAEVGMGTAVEAKVVVERVVAETMAGTEGGA